MCVEYDLLYHGTEIQVNRKTEFYIFFYIIAADFADDPIIFNRAGALRFARKAIQSCANRDTAAVMLFCVRDDGVACKFAEYDRIYDRVTAEAVRAVNVAGNFACGVQAGNRFTVCVEHARIFVDGYAAHCVVDARFAERCNPRAVFKLYQIEPGPGA